MPVATLELVRPHERVELDPPEPTDPTVPTVPTAVERPVLRHLGHGAGPQPRAERPGLSGGTGSDPNDGGAAAVDRATTRSTTIDERALRAALDRIVGDPDPVRANRAITAAHHELGELLADELGPDTGANFHTWAVWGSKEAGTTIGRRDVRGLTVVVAVAAMVAGAGLGRVLALIGDGLGVRLTAHSALLVAGTAAVAAVAAALTTRRFLDRARHHISHGNRIVLDEIGGVTARYLATCGGDAGSDRTAWLAFAATLRPGETEDGGQQALREAFACYHAARFEPDRHTRHQLVFAGNCLAVRHEHVRLQHDIASSMPRLLRRWITRSLLDFWVGAEHLHVGRDLPAPDGQAHPPTLRRLTVPAAVRIDGEMRQAGRRPGAAARSWASFDDRMHFVVELFRSRHLSPEVAAAPYAVPVMVLRAPGAVAKCGSPDVSVGR